MAVTDRERVHRYDARLAGEIERKWQDRWEERRTFDAPNPAGSLLAAGPPGVDGLARRPPLYVLDMFPYPSGDGLHVGHPLGYIGTDVFARFQRMSGRNVLHAMGYDAFGLPAEQYAVRTGRHPRDTTAANIANMRRQLRALGLGHDPRRSVSTTDVGYYRWTQWIFLQLFHAWYDTDAGRARPIGELVAELEAGVRDAAPLSGGTPWAELAPLDRRRLVDRFRLAYLDEQPVNWCPELGTVLANEEVTAEGRSERGNHPVYRRPLEQWMLRITAYAERLLADLDLLEWPEPIKAMQRNWIGRSTGAEVRFRVVGRDSAAIPVFTTRPDTLFGATYMVLAPEHPLVDELTPGSWPASAPGGDALPAAWRGTAAGHGDPSPRGAVARYRDSVSRRSELERQAEGREKTGLFTGAFATNPVNGAPIPIFVADYVLMGYGTGAIMAVPAHDQRDFEFARAFELPVVCVVEPPPSWFEASGLAPGADTSVWPSAFSGDGVLVGSSNAGVTLDGLEVPAAKEAISAWLAAEGLGAPTVGYKLRDWLFSRQRYWGEPFPIVYDADGLPVALPESMLPVELPEIDDFAPRATSDPGAPPEPPLGRAAAWRDVELDLPPVSWAGGSPGPRRYRRELNTMPQWAGSCWYFLRYLDPTNDQAFVGAEAERYWMHADRGGRGGVDLYVGGVEHAVLHLLYARFWHKVLFDLGHVSTPEPFHRLFNQGYIQAYAYTDARGMYVEASEVEERDGGWFHDGAPVTREYGKIGKSLHNVVTPDDIFVEYGADTLRLYEMFMGPLDASRPWSTTDIVGVHRFLQRLWRNVVDESSGEAHVRDVEPGDETLRLLHRAIAAVGADMASLGFNTAIARLFELNNHLTRLVEEAGAAPRSVVEPLVLMVAPLAPHIAEELWERLGHARSLAYEPFPSADPARLVDETVEVPVQVDGKVRARISVPRGAAADELERRARTEARVVSLLDGVTVLKVVVVPGRLVNFVVS